MKKYFKVFKESAYNRSEIADRLALKIFLHLKGEEVFFHDVTEMLSDKEELKEAAREERERIRWSQSYSRNPIRLKYKVYTHAVDENGVFLPSKKEIENAIAYAKKRATEDIDFAMKNAEFIASL